MQDQSDGMSSATRLQALLTSARRSGAHALAGHWDCAGAPGGPVCGSASWKIIRAASRGRRDTGSVRLGVGAAVATTVVVIVAADARLSGVAVGAAVAAVAAVLH